MAQAEPPHLEMGQQDPEDYHLDLDAGEEVDDFDFQLEGVYDKEGQYHSVDTGAGDTANTADFEIAFDEEETRDDHDHSDGAPAQPTEPAQDADGDAGTDYNDEIGYDEDDITDDFGNVETGEPASPDLEPSAGFSAEDQELNEHSIDADARVATAAEQQDALDHISGEGAQIPESTDLQDSYDQSFDMGAEAHVVEAGNGDVEELASGGLGQNGLLVEQDPEHLSDKDGGANAETARASSTDRSNDGHDHKGSLAEQETTLGLYLDEVVKGTNNTSDTSAEVPDIRVLYNEVDYSLFGSLTDDPDTYFLTDANELDGPLSDFLCSLREVIAHEISPHDELAIRIEPLTLEFGERSRKRFLRRSFREILDCYAALFANQAVDTPRLVLQLLVRHDCEERFVELLESTGISEGPSRVSGYSENLSEDMDERSSVNANEDEEFHESPEDEDEDLEQDQADGEEAPVAETTEDAEDQVRALEDLSAPGLQVGPDESYEIMGDESELQHDLSGLESREAAQPEHSGENNLEGNNQDLYYEEFDFSEVVADGEGEYAVETEDASGGPAGDLAANQSLEELGLSFDISEQAVEENDSHPLVDETNGASGVDGGEEIVAAAAATPVPGSSSNDNGANLLLELDSALDTIHEQPANGDDADASIYHDTDISADLDESQDADLQQETTHAFPDNGDTTNSKNSWDETHAAAAETTSSNHTSATSTVNGDEIDYEDQEQDQHQDHPAESFVLDGEAEEDDGDEIDWGNDGDENQDEGQNTEQKSPALAPTPSSPLGKRSRADEAESSVDEADHKRRRT